MSDDQVMPKAQKTIEYRVPPEGMFRAYSNNVRMATTNFDVRVLFGQIAEVADDKVTVDQLVQVTMTWPETKILADFLQANVKAYEELNGPINPPKNLDKIVVPQTFEFPAPK